MNKLNFFDNHPYIRDRIYVGNQNLIIKKQNTRKIYICFLMMFHIVDYK